MIKLGKVFQIFLGGMFCMVGLSAQSSKESLGKVVVTISVDWEGRSLEANNMQAMEKFRKRFKSIPLTHFFNAAYFTRKTAPSVLIPQIKKVLRSQDELGLHIHCWRSLVMSSGVNFLREPTYWGPEYPLTEFEGDLGHEVELDAYSLAEVRKIVQNSIKILHQNGYKISNSFRCGGWLASPKILEAIRAEGFLVDSSATARRWHAEELKGLPLYDRLGVLWPNITPHSQPYFIDTKAGQILEMPDTGALADYITALEMSEHLSQAIERVTSDSRRFVHLGFHQESAEEYLPRLVATLDKWENHPKLYFCTVEQAAQIFQTSYKAPKDSLKTNKE